MAWGSGSLTRDWTWALGSEKWQVVATGPPGSSPYWFRNGWLFIFKDSSTLSQSWLFVTQSCLTLCNPIIYSPPGSSVHGILQARILEWVAISFSRGSSQPRMELTSPESSWIDRRVLHHWATREAQVDYLDCIIFLGGRSESSLAFWKYFSRLAQRLTCC